RADHLRLRRRRDRRDGLDRRRRGRGLPRRDPRRPRRHLRSRARERARVRAHGAHPPRPSGRTVRLGRAGMTRWVGLLPYAAAIAIALALPRLLYPVLALDILLWGLFAVSVDLLLGFAGLLSFGHAAFWGAAGYAAGLAAREGKLAFPLAVLCGVGVALLLALPIGYLSIRRKGIY